MVFSFLKVNHFHTDLAFIGVCKSAKSLIINLPGKYFNIIEILWVFNIKLALKSTWIFTRTTSWGNDRGRDEENAICGCIRYKSILLRGSRYEVWVILLLVLDHVTTFCCRSARIHADFEIFSHPQICYFNMLNTMELTTYTSKVVLPISKAKARVVSGFIRQSESCILLHSLRFPSKVESIRWWTLIEAVGYILHWINHLKKKNLHFANKKSGKQVSQTY